MGSNYPGGVIFVTKRYQRIIAERQTNTEPLTVEQWLLIKKYFNYRCCYCGTKTKLEQDHLRALSHGGKTTLANIVPCCRSCNAKKNAQHFEKWYKLQPFFDEQRLGKIRAFIITSGILVNAEKYRGITL